MGKHNEFGKLGEQFAVAFLLGKGYEILERNHRYLKAEIDIIAKLGNTLAIIEVKSRNYHHLLDPKQAIKPKKIKLLVMAADHYIVSNELEVEVRFDIITVLKTPQGLQLEHHEDAFYHF